jgi:cell wall-associated NlpC family hydrolase
MNPTRTRRLRSPALTAAFVVTVASLTGCGNSEPSSPPSVAEAAVEQIGTPYAWGGGDQHGPTTGIAASGSGTADGFDGSGLVLYAVARASNGTLVLPHHDAAQIADPRGRTVTDPADLAPGDIIQPHPGHVVIWLGNNQIVEAPPSGDAVEVSDWTPPPAGLTARRFH